MGNNKDSLSPTRETWQVNSSPRIISMCGNIDYQIKCPHCFVMFCCGYVVSSCQFMWYILPSVLLDWYWNYRPRTSEVSLNDIRTIGKYQNTTWHGKALSVCIFSYIYALFSRFALEVFLYKMFINIHRYIEVSIFTFFMAHENVNGNLSSHMSTYAVDSTHRAVGCIYRWNKIRWNYLLHVQKWDD